MITYEAALAGLQRAIALKGEDYIYPSANGCVYFRDGEPSCIVGHVLADHGWTDNPSAVDGDTSIDCLWREGVIELDSRAGDLLADVQGLQDSGWQWGEAVANTVLRIESREAGA